MTVAPSLILKPLPKSERPGVKGEWRRPHYGFRHWVAPSPLVRDFILDHKHEWQSKFMSSSFSTKTMFMPEDMGWRETLSREMADIMRCSQEAVLRRLWGVMSGEGKVCKIEFAEAAAMACGLDLDRDTNIPSLPGNKNHALDLLAIRAEMADTKLTSLELHRLARQTTRLCSLIIRYPHNTERLLDLAPLNCLRPPE